MRASRHTRLAADAILILLTTFLFCFGVGGHSHLDEEEEEEPDHKSQGLYSFHSTWRGKRMSQMSCHCCSNSFNSHCCLQCMRSVGKRSDSAESEYDFDETPEDTLERLLSPDKSAAHESAVTNDWTMKSLLCFCCILQMERQTSSKLSCCDKCPERLHWIERLSMKEKDLF